MSKLSRTVLKEIVKECIMEIFEESFFNSGDVLNESSARRGKSSTQKKSVSHRRPNTSANQPQHLGRRSSLDTISYNQAEQRTVKNESYDRKINNITNKLTSDPIMAEIFKDTANSTLQTQTSAESSRSRGPSVLASGDAAALKAHNSDPTELFAESASKWATLAFSNAVARK